MRYDPNYNDQFFYDSSNDIGLSNVFDIMKSEMSRRKDAYQNGVKRPPSPYGKGVGIGVLVLLVLWIIIFGICFLITKSFIYSLIMAMCGLFVGFGFVLIFMGVYFFILLPKKCCLPVEATCIGHSISGSNNSRGRMQTLRCPVFEYDYGGEHFVAFDAIYDNTSKIPFVGLKTTIQINPDKPDELVWNFEKSRLIFFIAGAVFAIALGSAFIWLTNQDESLLNQILPSRQAAVEDTVDAAGRKLNEDGRIILTDEYLDELIAPHFPGTTWTIRKRNLKEVQKNVNGEQGITGFFFEPDDVQNYNAVSEDESRMSDYMKNAKPGDEFYFVEYEDKTATIFPCAEYVYEGSELLGN